MTSRTAMSPWGSGVMVQVEGRETPELVESEEFRDEWDVCDDA